MHRFADLDDAGIGLVLRSDHAEQRSLAGTVRANDANDAARRQFEGEIVDQKIVAEALSQVFEVDDVLSEPLGDRDDDLRGLGLLFAGFLEQLFVALVPRLGFGLPRARRRRDPVLLARERALARFFLAALLFEPLALLRKPGRMLPS